MECSYNKNYSKSNEDHKSHNIYYECICFTIMRKQHTKNYYFLLLLLSYMYACLLLLKIDFRNSNSLSKCIHYKS